MKPDTEGLIAKLVASMGREVPVLPDPSFHAVLGSPLQPVPEGSSVAYFALGCFWGAEKLFWQLDGVTSTAVGYMGGSVVNPTYDEVCTGYTGHAETVRVCFDPVNVSYEHLLRTFFENHDPTQGDRQGNDVGSQYRSAIWTTCDEEQDEALAVRDRYQAALTEAGYGAITTTIEPAGTFYFAEAYHQQYLDKNPNGYCPIHATGVKCSP